MESFGVLLAYASPQVLVRKRPDPGKVSVSSHLLFLFSFGIFCCPLGLCEVSAAMKKKKKMYQLKKILHRLRHSVYAAGDV